MNREDAMSILKHLATYYPIYEAIRCGVTDMDQIKQYLMFECNKPESTARMQISSLKYMPLLNVKDNLVTIDRKTALELEDELEFIFEWSQYDRRCEKIKEFEKAEIEYEKKIEALKNEIDSHKSIIKELEEKCDKAQYDLYLGKCENTMLTDKIRNKTTESMKLQEQLTNLQAQLSKSQNKMQAIRNIITEYKSIKDYKFIKRWKMALQALDKIGSIVGTSAKEQMQTK